MAAASSQKALDKINAQVQAGNFYEAQQMYKTVYHRYKSRKQLSESYQILQKGSVTQLRHKQLTCGLELARMLVEAYVADRVPATGDAADGLSAIVLALPAPASGEDVAVLEECGRFVTAAIKWAHKQGSNEVVRRMHGLYADYIWQSYGWRQLGRAQLHYTRSSDADAFATVLSECSASGVPGEEDLFLARALLQTLACAVRSDCAAQLHHARALYAAYSARRALPDTPLAHFCGMLLEALERNSYPLMHLLSVRYAPSLARDALLEAFLARIEETWFNTAQTGRKGGLLGSLLKGLFMEGDEEE